MTIRLYSWPLCANMTSSIKPEVHNALQRRRIKTVLRPQVSSTRYLVKTERVVPEICSRTEIQTDTQHSAVAYTGSGVTNQLIIYRPAGPPSVCLLHARYISMY